MSVIRTLLWKDYRQNRQFLIAAGVLLLFPYAFSVVVAVVETARHGQMIEEGWTPYVLGASLAALGIATLLCGFIGANAIAGERVDRSAEFTAYLPISPHSAVLSKAVLALGICAFMLLANGSIYCLAVWMADSASRPLDYGFSPPAVEWVTGMVITAVFLFGVSWLISSLVARPAIAASSAIVAMIVLVMVLELIGETQPRDSRASVFFLWYSIICLLVGPGCFFAGTLHYLRRVEP